MLIPHLREPSIFPAMMNNKGPRACSACSSVFAVQASCSACSSKSPFIRCLIISIYINQLFTCFCHFQKLVVQIALNTLNTREHVLIYITKTHF